MRDASLFRVGSVLIFSCVCSGHEADTHKDWDEFDVGSSPIFDFTAGAKRVKPEAACLPIMLKSLGILAMLGALLLGGLSMVQPSLNTPATQPQDDGKIGKPQSADVDAGKSALLEKREVDSQKAGPWGPEWVSVYVSALYSLFAGFTLIGIWRQGRTMNRQAVTMERTLAAMKEQDWAAREKERARIVVEIVPLDLHITHELWRVTFRVRNIGPTRAFNIWLNVKFEFTSSPVPPPIPEPRMLSHLSRIRAEKRRHVFFRGDEWNEAKMQDVAAGKLFLHMRGTVDYQDIFGGFHVTPFRHLWNANLGTLRWEDLTPRWFPAVHKDDPKPT